MTKASCTGITCIPDLSITTITIPTWVPSTPCIISTLDAAPTSVNIEYLPFIVLAIHLNLLSAISVLSLCIVTCLL